MKRRTVVFLHVDRGPTGPLNHGYGGANTTETKWCGLLLHVIVCIRNPIPLSFSLSSLIGVQIGVRQKRSTVVMQSASIGWHSQFKSAEEKAQVTCGDAFALVTARICRCSRQQ